MKNRIAESARAVSDTTVMPATKAQPARRWAAPPFFVTIGMNIESRAAEPAITWRARIVRVMGPSVRLEATSAHVPIVTPAHHDFRHIRALKEGPFIRERSLSHFNQLERDLQHLVAVHAILLPIPAQPRGGAGERCRLTGEDASCRV